MLISKAVEAARAAGRSFLSEPEGKSILAAAGFDTPKFSVASSEDHARSLARELRPPFAVKVISPDIVHKSDVGGVITGLPDSDAVGEAIKKMAAAPKIKTANIDGWLVEEMAPNGYEFAIGGVNDPSFGPMILLAVGGIFIEVLEDIALRICPITEMDAREMISEIKYGKIFDGVRGSKPMDPRRLVEIMLLFGGVNGLFYRNANLISEADVNPLIVSEDRVVAVDSRFIISEESSDCTKFTKAEPNHSILSQFQPLFEPKTVAVLGASSKSKTIANTFIRRLKDFGYPGNIYPIHPTVHEIEGLSTFPDLRSVPEVIDYAYIAIRADLIPDILAKSKSNVRFAQVISAGFAETTQGVDSQLDLVNKARQNKTRILGPNCLGTYSPRGGLTFPANAPKELGSIGVVSQSGGLSTDIIKRGEWRGLRFSSLVTIGNSADVSPVDLVEFYFADPHTRAIGLYLEDIKDGPRFSSLLRSKSATKPVVILLGGQSSQGKLAAASHTGALATNYEAWQALEKQSNVVIVTTINAFIDVLLALQSFELRPAQPTRNVALFGNGGGTSVLGADIFAKLDLNVSPFNSTTIKNLDALKLPPGTSILNPVDTPVKTLQEKDGWIAGEILDIIYEYGQQDAIAMHLNLASFVGRGGVDPVNNLLRIVEKVQQDHPGKAHFGLALRTDGSPELDDAKRDYRERARLVNVPVYDEIPELALALSAVSKLEKKLSKSIG